MDRRNVERARASARKTLDEWIRQTGAINAASSWRYELESIIEQAVNAGARAILKEHKDSHPGTPYREIVWDFDASDLRKVAVASAKLHLAEQPDPPEYLGKTVCGMNILPSNLIDEEIPARWANTPCERCWMWLKEHHYDKTDEEVKEVLAEFEE